MKPIVGANHKATWIEITLPVDADGNYAFDENGDPVSSRTPVVLKVRRWDCMRREDVRTMNAALKAAAELKHEDGTPFDRDEISVEQVSAMVKPYVDDATLELVRGLQIFELEQVAERIQEGSTISVGELLASSTS